VLTTLTFENVTLGFWPGRVIWPRRRVAFRRVKIFCAKKAAVAALKDKSNQTTNLSLLMFQTTSDLRILDVPEKASRPLQL
jgi:hypothetical protein